MLGEDFSALQKNCPACMMDEEGLHYGVGLLAALAGALNAIGQYAARELNMPLHGLDIQIDGDCNADCFFGKSFAQRSGFSEIRVSLTADTDADAETVAVWKERLLARCPVLDNLQTPVTVITDIRLGK